VIESFRHKGLGRFYANDDRSGLLPDKVERIRDVLSALDAAQTIRGMSHPSFRLHRLKGNLKNFGPSRFAPIGGLSFVFRAAGPSTWI
jgi:proteic killer suppression protein